MAAPLIVSCLFIAMSSLIAEFFRIVIKKVLSDKPLHRVLCLEFVATAELCAVCFELVIGKLKTLKDYLVVNLNAILYVSVAEVYGVRMYALLLFILTLWWASHWEDAAACPYIHVENYLEGTNSLRHTILCCLAELAGGFAIYRYSSYL